MTMLFVTNLRSRWFYRQWFLVLTMALLALGCNSTTETVPPSSAPELSMESQVSAVRSGLLEEIAIETTPLSDSDLLAIVDRLSATGANGALRTLKLDHASNSIGDPGLKSLAKLATLEHLRIRGGTLTDQAAIDLSTLIELRILNLPQTQFSNAALESFGKLPKLEQLRLGSRQIDSEGIAKLKAFPALKRLHLIGTPLVDADLEILASMPKLESLYLDEIPLSDAAYERLFQTRPDLHVHLGQSHHDRDPHGHSHE